MNIYNHNCEIPLIKTV